MDCFYMSSKNLSKKPKKTWVFLVFWLTSSKSSSKKPKKKTLRFFLVFSRSWPKKTKKTRGKPKKTKHEPQTKHSLKSFGFFGFSRFFGFWFSRGLASRGRGICEAVTSGPYLILVLQLCFSFFVAIYPKKHLRLPAFGIHYFPMQTPFPKICPAIYFKLLSLKAGLFQREVALFLWQPDFFKGK